MGYCTYFTDETEGGMTEEELAKLEEFAGWKVEFSDSMKWYDYPVHMAKMSVHFPDRLFVIHGDGEKGDDFWRGYWQNGKHWKAVATVEYPDFDENKMLPLCAPIPPKPFVPTEIPEEILNGVSTAGNVEWDF